MFKFEIDVDLEKLAKLAKKVDGSAKLVRTRLMVTLEADLERARTDMIGTYLSGTETTATTLARRSGALAGSWNISMTETEDSFTGKLAQDQRRKAAVYGPVHEVGATITAKRVRNLAIPLTEEARQAGTPRKFNDLFVIRSKRGNLLLVRRNGKQIEPMYKLQPSVTIPPRPYLRPTSEKWFPIILEDFGKEMVRIEQDWNQ